jgi:hypothetical protein
MRSTLSVKDCADEDRFCCSSPAQGNAQPCLRSDDSAEGMKRARANRNTPKAVLRPEPRVAPALSFYCRRQAVLAAKKIRIRRRRDSIQHRGRHSFS